MDQASIIQYIAETFDGVDIFKPEERGGPALAAGDTFFMYDPERTSDAKHSFPFATIVTKDYEGDEASKLNRPSVFRLNIGVTKQTFESLFGSPTAASDTDEADPGNYDFAALDQLLPHPVYGRYFFVCVLNPTEQTFESLKPLLAEAYGISLSRHQRSTPASER
jgi:Family of unknown function (DUF6194)